MTDKDVRFNHLVMKSENAVAVAAITTCLKDNLLIFETICL
jgi:hypothetical protein